MIADTTIDRQIRHHITKKVECMDLRQLQRIAYMYHCEQLNVRPDSWKLYPED